MPPTHVVSYDQRERQTDEGGRGREGLDDWTHLVRTRGRSVGRIICSRDLSLSLQ